MRAVYQGTGMVLVAVAAVGAFLPLLPSTPFLLLATGCFMRSSPQWNERLYRSPLFGRALRDWHVHRIVRPRAKIVALLSLGVVNATTLVCGHFALWTNVCLLTITAIVGTAILRLPGERHVVAEA